MEYQTKFFKFAGTIPALALVGLLSTAIDAHASTLVVDRGLPAENLNNAAGSNRSNVAWGFNGAFHTGDTFSLPSTGNSALPSWRVDKLIT